MGGFANNAPIVTDGLVFYVDAGNSKSYPGVSGGTTWTDLVGGNDGTLTNMETNPVNAGYVYDSGNGGSIVLDGVDDYVDFSNPSELNTLTISGMSVSAWINPTTTGDNGTGRIFSKREGAALNGWLFFMDATNTIGVQVLTTTGGSNIFQSRGADNYITLNEWNHVAFTYSYNSGGPIKLYVNGSEINYSSQDTSNSNVPTSDSNGSLIMGDTSAGYNRSFNGSMSSGMIYNRVLSSDEILQNYNALKNRFV